jgi:signal transduction histidine kinase
MAELPATSDDVERLWLAALQRAIGRASHDVKDSLNGVSVNLEVIRSRAARPEAPASAVSVFAEAAGQQLERLSSLIEALLALGRPERTAHRRVATVCSASSSGADSLVELRESEVGMGSSTVTRVRGDVMRLALLAPLLDAVVGADRSSRAPAVQCTIGGDAGNVVVTIDAPGRRTTMPGPVVRAVRAGGVSWTEESQDLSLAFPRA